MGRRALKAAVACVAAGLLAVSPVSTQSAPYFDTLSETQQRLLDGLASRPASSGHRSADARASFDGAAVSFRTAFATITTALATLSLSDHENGEILGVALDLVSAIEPLAGQPAATSATRAAQLAVALAPGARDRLRRSSEFAPDRGRATPDYPIVFVRTSGPPLQFALDGTGSRALVSLSH